MKKVLFTLIAVAGIVLMIAWPEQKSENLGADILSLTIDGEAKSISYTDDNIGEDLIIRTDKSEYANFFGNITVDFSIKNNSNKDQTVKILFSFKDQTGQKKYVSDISEYGGEYFAMVDDVSPTVVETATGTEIILEPIKISKSLTRWNQITLADAQISFANRKSVQGSTGLKTGSAFIARGETKFFQAKIKYTDFQGREEFFLEAIGDKNSYGHLDPWTMEDKFNSDTKTTGDLSPQDSWSGNLGFDVVTTGTPYEGDQHIINAAGDQTITNSLPNDNAGTVYFAMKFTSIGSNNNAFHTNLTSSPGDGTIGCEIQFISVSGTSANIRYFNATAFTTWVTGATISNYYVFEVQLNVGGVDCTARYHDGSSWSSTATFDGEAAYSGTVTDIVFYIGTGATLWTAYWDTITPTNPVVVAEAAEETIWQPQNWW